MTQAPTADGVKLREVTHIHGWRTKDGTVYSGDGYPVPLRKFLLDNTNCAALLVEREPSVAEEWCAYMDDAVSKAPEPLRQLGEYLSGLLDEDRWKTAERYLNAAALAAIPRADIRREALEEAAKVARGPLPLDVHEESPLYGMGHPRTDFDRGVARGREMAATAIRARAADGGRG